MNWRALMLLLVLSLVLPASTGSAQTTVAPILVPIGGGTTGDLLPGNGYPPAASVTRAEYTRMFQGLAPEATARAVEGVVKVLVLPIALSPNPEFLTPIQKTDILRVAESRFFHVKEACQLAMPANFTCQASMAPLYVRTDALDPVMLDYFAQQWSMIFILSGDPATAMEVIQGTPVEAALGMLYRQGVMISGTGGGAKLLAQEVISNPLGDGQNTPLAQAETFPGNDAPQTGLLFGIEDAYLETQFYQLGRMGSLLAAISSPDGPQLGIGIDAYTGVHIPSGQSLEKVFGQYNITVLDAETYGAADNARLRNCSAGSACSAVLSIRNVLFHLLAPGLYSYDLSSRQHSLNAPAPVPDRSYVSLAVPPGAGPLILAGDLSQTLQDNPILDHFGDLTEGDKGRVLVITAGYPSDSSTDRMANWIADELKGSTVKLVLTKNATVMPSFPKHYTGIIFAAGNQAKIKPGLLGPIQEAWLAGTPLLADNGAASAMGANFSFHGPTPAEGKPAEMATQASFLKGETQIQAGLHLLDINIEPQVLEDNRWGRLVSLAYNHPSKLAIGIDRDTALEIDHMGARVLGVNSVFVLDFRTAELEIGDNRSYVIANGLLDVFIPGEELVSAPASAAAAGDVGAGTEKAELPARTGINSTSAIEASQPGIVRGTRVENFNIWIGLIPLAILAIFTLLLVLLRVRRRQAH
jgi:cyanophycinase-like exopeptidase